MYVIFASEEYRMTPFWIGVNTVEVLFIFLSLFEGYCTFMEDYWTCCSKLNYRALFIFNWGKKVAGLLIGIYYLFWFNHVNVYTGALYLFFLMYPYWMMTLLHLDFMS